MSEPRRLPPITYYCEPCDVAAEGPWNEPPVCRGCQKPMRPLRADPPPLFHPVSRGRLTETNVEPQTRELNKEPPE